MDFEKVLTEDPANPFLTLDDFFKGAIECDLLGYDTEGTGLDLVDGRDYTYGVSLAYRNPHLGIVATYLPFRMPYGDNLPPGRLNQFLEALQQRAGQGKPLTSHNLPYDFDAYESLGGDASNLWGFDTVQWANLVNENYPFAKTLENCAQHYAGIGKVDNPPKNTWKFQSAETLYKYARNDAIVHLKLGEVLVPLMEKEKLLGYVWPKKFKTMQILREMRKRGVWVDTELCEREYSIGVGIMEEVAELLRFNPGSTKQLGAYLIEELGLPVVAQTPAGNPSFDNDAMEIYDEILERLDNPAAELIRTYRGWQKVTSSCYKSYLDKLSPDGRLRTNYHQHRTKTGRLSSSNPNLQQIPRQSSKPWQRNVKRAFGGKPGCVLLEGDYSQLEFRLSAAYAREQRLLEIFNDPERDIFTEMSKQLGMERQDTKTQTYTISYGGGVRRLKEVFGVTYEEAANRKRNFELNYPRLKMASDKAAFLAKTKKKVPMWTGRYRHFRYSSEAHKAFNSVMQGGAAEIVEHTMHRVNEQIDNEECRTLLQVHDSLVFEVQEDKAEYYKPIIKEVMEDVKGPDGEEFGVYFKVDVHKFS